MVMEENSAMRPILKVFQAALDFLMYNPGSTFRGRFRGALILCWLIVLTEG